MSIVRILLDLHFRPKDWAFIAALSTFSLVFALIAAYMQFAAPDASGRPLLYYASLQAVLPSLVAGAFIQERRPQTAFLWHLPIRPIAFAIARWISVAGPGFIMLSIIIASTLLMGIQPALWLFSPPFPILVPVACVTTIALLSAGPNPSPALRGAPHAYYLLAIAGAAVGFYTFSEYSILAFVPMLICAVLYFFQFPMNWHPEPPRVRGAGRLPSWIENSFTAEAWSRVRMWFFSISFVALVVGFELPGFMLAFVVLKAFQSSTKAARENASRLSHLPETERGWFRKLVPQQTLGGVPE